MSLYSDTLSDQPVLVFLLNGDWLAEKQHISFIHSFIHSGNLSLSTSGQPPLEYRSNNLDNHHQYRSTVHRLSTIICTLSITGLIRIFYFINISTSSICTMSNFVKNHTNSTWVIQISITFRIIYLSFHLLFRFKVLYPTVCKL